MSINGAEILNDQPMELVDSSIGKNVTLLCAQGKEFHGILQGIDESANCILSDVTEKNPYNPNFIEKHYSQTLVNCGAISIIIPTQQ